MNDEDKWDREQQHLDDHHYDLMYEEKLANCEHEDYIIEGIGDAAYSSLELEIKCSFCEKIGTLTVDITGWDIEGDILHLKTNESKWE